MWIKIKILILFIFIGHKLFAQPFIINVTSQKEFDEIGAKVEYAINSGDTDIQIHISPGSYLYSEGQLSFCIRNKKVTISIIGEDAVLIGTSKKTDKAIPSCYYSHTGVAKSFWSDVYQLNSIVDVLNKDAKLCRIPYIKGTDVQVGDYIQISQWYKSSIYRVCNVNEIGIEFIADDLSYLNQKHQWSINNDYLYGKEYPRYRIYHSSLSESYDESSISTCLTFYGSSLKKLIVDGISFRGCSQSDSYKGLIHLNNVDAESIDIKNCTFENALSTCVMLNNTCNVTLSNNLFCDNYYSCIYVNYGSNNIRIIDNSFLNNGLGWSNSHLIVVRGDRFYINENKFSDFPYSAIGVGEWWNNIKKAKISGIIESNEFFYSDSYLKSYRNHTLMDSGVIYVWTQTDGVTIRNNYIHDIAGMKDNRGIFCDDGTKNVTVTDNVIQHIQNSYCIDLRKVTNVSTKVLDHNTGNVCENNVVDGDIRFYIRDKSCRVTNNKKIGDRGYKTMNAYKKWKRKIKMNNI